MRRVPVIIFLLALLAGCGGPSSNFSPVIASTTLAVAQPVGSERTAQYQNPVPVHASDGSIAESCPDPSIIQGQTPNDHAWYVFCTNDRFVDYGSVHLMPILRSTDLIHWTHVGDVFSKMPPWVAGDGGLWAPDIQFFNGKYVLYYSVSNTAQGGSAIYVATADSPLGPWTASGTPVVEQCCGSYDRSTIDPSIVEDNGQRYIFYGSFDGGIQARTLSADGMHSVASSQVQISPSDRFEGSYLIKRDGYFYLMLSAGRCCDGEFAGYGVFVARSRNVLGPYIDRDGNSIATARVGGTPVLAMNGNRWLGPGHNAVATDAAGQDWIVYHAVDRQKPKFAGSWTRRPLMVDRLDWKDGWPLVRGGSGASDASVNSPAVEVSPLETPTWSTPDLVGVIIPQLSDEFDVNFLDAHWTWVRPPGAGQFSISNGALHFPTQAAEIYVGNHTASILTEPVPSGDYAVDLKMSNNVPLTGRYNFVQGGLVIYANDDNYIKLVSSSINDTRQIEFAKQGGVPTQYGKSLLNAPADTLYLRIVKRSSGAIETYTAYSSYDGVAWQRGSTWTHALGSGARIGLVSMGGAGFTTDFDYIHVYSLAN
jgi:arabinan endo-1,5-alpha-L-arabinosidase